MRGMRIQRGISVSLVFTLAFIVVTKEREID